MDIITQEAQFGQGAIKYAQRKGVTEASIRYKVCRMSIYRWIARYNGKWWSLKERSHCPKHHSAEQTEEEYELIKRHYPYYDDMIMLWDILREKGYKRCYQTILRAIRRLKPDKAPCAIHPRKPKPYKWADYPGQKVQIDVKFAFRLTAPAHTLITSALRKVAASAGSFFIQSLPISDISCAICWNCPLIRRAFQTEFTLSQNG